MQARVAPNSVSPKSNLTLPELLGAVALLLGHRAWLRAVSRAQTERYVEREQGGERWTRLDVCVKCTYALRLRIEDERQKTLLDLVRS